MTNREHILKLIAELDDETLYETFKGLPQDKRGHPIRYLCEQCPRLTNPRCYSDKTACDAYFAAWMNMEVQLK